MKVHVYSNQSKASQAVADVICNIVHRKPNASFIFPAGRTPKTLYQILVQRNRQKLVNFSRIRAFALDEFLDLSPTDKRSFAAFLTRHFLRPIRLPTEQFWPLHTTGRCHNTDCKKTEEAIQKTGGIDLAILGLGLNGHVGFNEPGSRKNSRTRVVKLANETRKRQVAIFGSLQNVPRHGVTLGLATLLESRRIALLAFGNEKTKVLQQVNQVKPTTKIPASQLKVHARFEVFVDQAAIH
jgi:glucosamine-6-phosphate deaminase